MEESFPTCYEQFIEYGRQEGLQLGTYRTLFKLVQLGTYRTLFKLVEDGDLSLEKAAKSVGLTVNEFLEKKKEYHSDSEWFN